MCQEETVYAALSGEIDHHTAREIRESIDEAISRCVPRMLVMDFKGVTFMDSSGIGLVMGRYKLMQETGGKLHLVNIAGHLKKVMMLAGLDRLAILDKPERPARTANEEGGKQHESDQHDETAV